MGTKFTPFGALAAALLLCHVALAKPPEFELAAKRWMTKAEFKIVGGQDADPSMYRWQVALLNASVPNVFYAQYCSGMFITASAVLTAAHCVEGLSEKEISVLVGASTLDGTGQTIDIRKIVLHDGYNSSSKENDIAVILLAASTAIEPVTWLDTNHEDKLFSENLDIYVSGWGLTDPFSSNSKSKSLKDTVVPMQTNDTCNRSDAHNNRVLESMFCAGLHVGGEDTCLGDSGGPATYVAEGKRMLAGIVSWGAVCGLPKKYGVYTRVSRFSDWLREAISR
ncbi:serine protease [Sinorhizobium meliloti]|uniref:serine protease n=1 Tax=Rhizobium meliloti TaxID=382 RepID=UPI000FDA5EA9|nr:serine protease [Sinorhizobium meliloti]RVG07957.1 serine protease [Sinorhizobium meliloti]